MNSSCSSLQSTSTPNIVAQGPSGGPASDETAGKTQNWAGYEATGNPYQDAEADWTVPAVQSGSASNAYYSASWVGLGQGTKDSDPLIQGGSETNYIGGIGSYYLWFEVYPEQPTEQVVDTNVRVNDSVGVHVDEVQTQISGCTDPSCGFIHLSPPAPPS
jgi:hypothetical protein